MNISRTIIVSFLFVINASAHASIADDFKLCATKALNEQNLSPKKITVDDGGESAINLDHNTSDKFREYKMDVSTRSGQEVGVVTCTFNRAGELKSATLLSKV